MEYFSVRTSLTAPLTRLVRGSVLFTAEHKSHYRDWAQLLIADILDPPDAFEGGRRVGGNLCAHLSGLNCT